jgi:hypothetical protein
MKIACLSDQNGQLLIGFLIRGLAPKFRNVATRSLSSIIFPTWDYFCVGHLLLLFSSVSYSSSSREARAT